MASEMDKPNMAMIGFCGYETVDGVTYVKLMRQYGHAPYGKGIPQQLERWTKLQVEEQAHRTEWMYPPSRAAYFKVLRDWPTGVSA